MRLKQSKAWASHYLQYGPKYHSTHNATLTSHTLDRHHSLIMMLFSQGLLHGPYYRQLLSTGLAHELKAIIYKSGRTANIKIIYTIIKCLYNLVTNYPNSLGCIWSDLTVPWNVLYCSTCSSVLTQVPPLHPHTYLECLFFLLCPVWIQPLSLNFPDHLCQNCCFPFRNVHVLCIHSLAWIFTRFLCYNPGGF